MPRHRSHEGYKVRRTLRRTERRRHRSGNVRRIVVTFDKVWPQEEDDEYPATESGFVDDEGVEMKLDRYDISDGLTLPMKTVKWLRDQGAYEASSSHFHKGVWYTTDYSTSNYRTGESESRSFHLEGFSEPEEKEIFRLFKERTR